MDWESFLEHRPSLLEAVLLAKAKLQLIFSWVASDTLLKAQMRCAVHLKRVAGSETNDGNELSV
jgi:hypothetical protein